MFFNTVKKLGFTMIELLIVIAVLGVLAVAVLSAINPIEQINRGKDTGSRSDAEQLLSAIDRYYTTQGVYPWQADSAASDILGWTPAVDVQDATPVTMMSKLASTTGAAEIKQSFVTRISNANYNSLYMYFRGNNGDSTYVCFKPDSGAFALEAATRCNGVGGAGLPTDLQPVAATVCATGEEYICLP